MGKCVNMIRPKINNYYEYLSAKLTRNRNELKMYCVTKSGSKTLRQK